MKKRYKKACKLQVFFFLNHSWERALEVALALASSVGALEVALAMALAMTSVEVSALALEVMALAMLLS